MESLSIVEEADGDEVLLYRSPSASSRSEKTLVGDNVRGDDNGAAPRDGREFHPFVSLNLHIATCRIVSNDLHEVSIMAAITLVTTKVITKIHLI